jgi:hypothetical protein
MNLINHKQLAESRLATQFRESTNLISYIKSLLVEADTLEQVFQDIVYKRRIENAENAQLDILGAIVGQSRRITVPIRQPSEFLYFGFDPYRYAGSLGDSDDPGVGKRFISLGEFPSTSLLLNDESYRTYIRARIARNSTASTPENIISHIKFIFGTDSVILVDGNTKYEVSIGKELSDPEIFTLLSNIIPKTVGVRVDYTVQFSENSFGFSNLPNAYGFGSVLDSNIGGTMAKLIF